MNKEQLSNQLKNLRKNPVGPALVGFAAMSVLAGCNPFNNEPTSQPAPISGNFGDVNLNAKEVDIALGPTAVAQIVNTVVPVVEAKAVPDVVASAVPQVVATVIAKRYETTPTIVPDATATATATPTQTRTPESTPTRMPDATPTRVPFDWEGYWKSKTPTATPRSEVQLTSYEAHAQRLIQLDPSYRENGSRSEWLKAAGITFDSVQFAARQPEEETVDNHGTNKTVISGVQVDVVNLSLAWPNALTTTQPVNGRCIQPDKDNPSKLCTDVTKYTGPATIYADAQNWPQLAPKN